MKASPVIGITTKIVCDPDYHIEVQGTCASYAQSVINAGGTPLYIPLLDPKDAVKYVNICDGIIFSGGEDVDPALYGESPSDKLGAVSRRRDDFEIALFNAFSKTQKPIFGICRGMQLINVALGGSLYQDLPSQLPSSVSHTDVEDRWLELVHEVDVKDGSTLRAITNDSSLLVNSIHHQGVKKLGSKLRICSTSPIDGLAEAIESDNSNSLIAVQWHPEVLWQNEKTKKAQKSSQALFQWLVSTSVK